MPNSISILALVCLSRNVSITLGLALDPAKAILILKALAQHLCIIKHVGCFSLATFNSLDELDFH